MGRFGTRSRGAPVAGKSRGAPFRELLGGDKLINGAG
jgi:hypothetical protein